MNFDDLELTDSQGRFDVVDPELAKLAHQIFNEFSAQRQELAKASGKVAAQVSPKHAVHFYRAAELCREMDMNPIEYVALQLEHMAASGKFWPQGIANKEAFRNRESQQQERTLMALRAYRAQLDLFKARERMFGARLALIDEANDFSPLFRCVMARRHNVDAVEAKYALQAVLELDQKPIAAEVFAGELGFLDEWRNAYGRAAV